MAMSEVMKTDMRQPSFLEDFGKGVADYARVKRFAIGMTEY